MNIALINASPKGMRSASKILLDELKNLLLTGHNVKEFHMSKPSMTENDLSELKSFSAWIFAFPLYVDGIPSHLLSCLRQIEKSEISNNAIDVYAIVNCGFYEGIQAQNALSIMENWCNKADLKWRTGIGYGGGGALESIKGVPLGSGPKASLGKAYTVFADAILSCASMDNTYISINFPRFLYKFAAEIGWVKMIRANGGKKRDLRKRLSDFGKWAASYRPRHIRPFRSFF